ncbi:MAG: hypothetical protein AAGI44_13395 [Pseudomonadota bacterium]
MLTAVAAAKIAARLLTGPDSDRDLINKALRDRGLPPYYLGEHGLNVEYQIANTPRRVWSWRKFDLVMVQFYLYYLPNIPEDREPNINDEIVLQLR